MTAPLVSTTDRPFQLLPPLDPGQRFLLRQSIEKNGVLEPVVFDEDGEILDGHHRVEIAEELGIEYPRRVIDDLDRPGKHMYALTVNVARRQLDQAARSALVAQMRIRGMSIRSIAEALGVPKTTVARDLAQVSHVGHLPEEITGKDNKSYAATRPPVEPTPTPGPVDLKSKILADLAEIGAEGTTQSAIGLGFRRGEVSADDLAGAISELLTSGVISVVGGSQAGTLFALTDLITETPGSVDADVAPPADPGTTPATEIRHPGAESAQAEAAVSTSPEVERHLRSVPPPGSPATWTPEQREANQREIDRKRMIAAGQSAARVLVMEVRASISTVVSAIDLGEKNLINPQMIADLRRAVDLLESRMEAQK